ncbi:3'(2'),5'-bisphosphate nucleotidase CysQ [Haloactinopolyspora sp.]|uniref:3'(2'),5'-bisphosphate nucleotidase CysQ n=1 Tax=Haloactinopolyspora sp. TaxID=1966353 RepID=UPI002625DAC1|nr:3'(2'),5'-bisphosphate nucleotidase CysQ [Haloactinopolyspora sp.]
MTHADAALAARLAQGAGEVLLDLRRTHGPVDGGRELRDAGDRAAQRYLDEQLSTHRPDDAVLSEEAADDPARLDAERVWIIDPLDGTREYAEGRSDWAVHVALWVGGELTAGAVALPGLGVTLSSDPAPQVPERTSDVVRVAVSRTRPPAEAEHVARTMSAELVPMGSAGYKAAAVIRGEVDAYIHAGGQYEWDSAAPVAVALAAGLHASRIDGAPMRYNTKDTYIPDLIVARPELGSALVAACAEVGDVHTATRSAR